ncbi:MAG: DUF4956 domain-containing protein [Bacteroidota bacterium]
MHLLLNNIFNINDYKLFDEADFFDLVLRYGFNFLITFIIVRLIYYPLYRNKDYLFTYFIFNSIIFMILHVMTNIKMEFGISFGLFAVFSILRYRTEDIPIKEMVYLFLIIAVALVNSLSTKKVSIAELLFVNAVIVGLIYAMEHLWLMRNENYKVILYEKIENIKPENYEILLQDLRDRTGLKVHRSEIKTIDFQNDTARLTIFYHVDPKNRN